MSYDLVAKSLDTIITRLGRNCRIIFCGDFRQSDLQKEEDRNGLIKFMNVIKNILEFIYISNIIIPNILT